MNETTTKLVADLQEMATHLTQGNYISCALVTNQARQRIEQLEAELSEERLDDESRWSFQGQVARLEAENARLKAHGAWLLDKLLLVPGLDEREKLEADNASLRDALTNRGMVMWARPQGLHLE